MRAYLGIDPGINGGIASILDGHAATVTMPVLRQQLVDTLKVLCTCDHAFVTIEKQKPQFVKRKDGRMTLCKGSHRLIADYNYILGVLDALNVRYQIVDPKVWQAEMLRDLPKTDRPGRKRQSLELAEQLFRLGKISDGESDALLIAEYGRRKCA